MQVGVLLNLPGPLLSPGQCRLSSGPGQQAGIAVSSGEVSPGELLLHHQGLAA